MREYMEWLHGFITNIVALLMVGLVTAVFLFPCFL